MTTQKKERIIGISFIRVLCAVGIVVYHFFCYTGSSFHDLSYGNWDGVLVSVFFIISGAMLSYNYPEINSYRAYFFKRWKSVFPSFYLCFIPLFFFSVIKQRSFFYLGSPARLLYSIFGLDGYFLYKGDNYYIVGEWFLGAIIMLYLIYPLILILQKKSRIIIPVILVGLYLFMLNTSFFVVDPFRNLITCSASFYAGTVLMKYREKIFSSKINYILCIGLLIILSIVPFPIHWVILTQVEGVALFIFLLRLGNAVMKRGAGRIFDAIGGISYQIFLVQSRLIREMAKIYNPTNIFLSAGYMILTVVGVIFLSMLLRLTEKEILKSKVFLRLEEKVTG